MAEDDESERGEAVVGMGSMDSTESRWVFQDEDDSEIEGDEEDDDGDVRRLREGRENGRRETERGRVNGSAQSVNGWA
ncbi:hypothetical protein NL676_022717 [Syzygium grande]|nr:hypothetical protein NL676_022717 [Syzygium grande]